jgi:hypothetical protein
LLFSTFCPILRLLPRFYVHHYLPFNFVFTIQRFFRRSFFPIDVLSVDDFYRRLFLLRRFVRRRFFYHRRFLFRRFVRCTMVCITLCTPLLSSHEGRSSWSLHTKKICPSLCVCVWALLQVNFISIFSSVAQT